jgi:hypothetical protein
MEPVKKLKWPGVVSLLFVPATI